MAQPKKKGQVNQGLSSRLPRGFLLCLSLVFIEIISNLMVIFEILPLEKS